GQNSRRSTQAQGRHKICLWSSFCASKLSLILKAPSTPGRVMVHTTIHYTLSRKEAQPHFYAFVRAGGVIELKQGKMFEGATNKFVSLAHAPASSGVGARRSPW
ncbi:MAG: hypothetical protein RR452_08135, partial [Clostridia bacterium]